MVDRPALQLLVSDQRVLPIEEEDVELLDCAVRDPRIAVVDQLVPRGDYRALVKLRAQEPECCLAHKFDPSDCRCAEPHVGECSIVRTHHRGETAEALN